MPFPAIMLMIYKRIAFVNNSLCSGARPGRGAAGTGESQALCLHPTRAKSRKILGSDLNIDIWEQNERLSCFLREQEKISIIKPYPKDLTLGHTVSHNKKKGMEIAGNPASAIV
jgi:hypothetical protein